jgi:hypothetical protein
MLLPRCSTLPIRTDTWPQSTPWTSHSRGCLIWCSALLLLLLLFYHIRPLLRLGFCGYRGIEPFSGTACGAEGPPAGEHGSGAEECNRRHASTSLTPNDSPSPSLQCIQVLHQHLWYGILLEHSLGAELPQRAVEMTTPSVSPSTRARRDQ